MPGVSHQVNSSIEKSEPPMQTRIRDDPSPSEGLKISSRKARLSESGISIRLRQEAWVMAKPNPSTLWKLSPLSSTL